MGNLEKELEDVELQITAHRVETTERERENRRREKDRVSKGPLIEEVGSEMDVTEDGGDGDSIGEGGIFIEVGKKRKRKGEQERAGGQNDWDNIPYEYLVKVLSKLPEKDQVNCMRDAGISMERAAAGGLGGDLGTELDAEDEFSPRLAPPAQEDADKTPCG